MTKTTRAIPFRDIPAAVVNARLALFIALAVFSFVLTATAARAQQRGTGARAGVSSDPNQFYFGGHFDTGPIFDRLSFRPNAEIGVGDHVTSVSGNFEFAYWWPIPRHPWHVYAGGGPAVNLYRWGDNDPHGMGGSTDVQPGFNLLIGAAHRRGLFAELKLGFIDSPEVKFGIGYTWK